MRPRGSGLAHMDPYWLLVYREDGQLIGPGMVSHAAYDAHAIAQAEIVRGSYAAELLGVGGLADRQIPAGNGKAFIGRVARPSSLRPLHQLGQLGDVEGGPGASSRVSYGSAS